MEQRRSTGLVVTAGVAAAVLWQLTAEIVSRMARAGAVPPDWLPAGSSFPTVTVLDLVPDGGLWVVGMLLSFVLVGVLVGLGARLVVRRGFDGVRSFLAIWMVVVLGAVLASVLTAPIIASYGGGARLSSSAYSGAYWGLVVGWLIAVVVALGSRRASS